MSDTMQPYQQSRQLKEKAKQYEAVNSFNEAAQLYQQAYALTHDSYSARLYIHCARKSGIVGARGAAKFAKTVEASIPDDQYHILFNREYVWAIYDGYLKKASPEHQEDDEHPEGADDDTNNAEIEATPTEFKKMMDAANRILALTNEELPCKLAIFAIFKEAKRLRRWSVARDFALRLDPQTLSTESKELNERKMLSDKLRWFYAITGALFNMESYDECIGYAREAIELFPNDSFHFRRWEALVNIRTNHIEEGLEQLKYIDTRFPKQWYVQSDIAHTYMQLKQFEDAWLYFCKGAVAPGDIKTRVKMISSMIDMQMRLERWQLANEHLHLLWAIETAQSNKQRADGSRQRILELRKRHADALPIVQQEISITAPSIPHALRLCRTNWEQTISLSQPRQKGRIDFVSEEKPFGFIVNESGKYHFKFNALKMKEQPVKGMEVEFEAEHSFDQKRGQMGNSAINIRIARA